MGAPQKAEVPTWTEVCALDEILPDTGVCVLAGGQQVAVFRIGDGEQVHAIDNRDPFSGANVLSRGLVCSLAGRVCVASPIYKQHFDLQTGLCLEDETQSVRAHEAFVVEGRVCVVVS
ncbi:nitrite reductase small subunit NirD [Polycyclovorans algicola]|uniref:nitrite reductase small subunit NirD n=1 Tax=Polycyclovorans algicola TaxID=616992 RepID=UPI0004A6F376|nr:nitrite reductase small subunit NirD [Polycyclovorans algicola]